MCAPRRIFTDSSHRLAEEMRTFAATETETLLINQFYNHAKILFLETDAPRGCHADAGSGSGFVFGRRHERRHHDPGDRGDAIAALRLRRDADQRARNQTQRQDRLEDRNQRRLDRNRPRERQGFGDGESDRSRQRNVAHGCHHGNGHGVHGHHRRGQMHREADPGRRGRRP